MRFGYSDYVQTRFPERVSGGLVAGDIRPDADVNEITKAMMAQATARLSEGAESSFAEIQAWRGAFRTMGLKPTQYRCASEALLRRFRKEATLPSIHPLIDLCNAASLAFAIPVAVFDLDRVEGDLSVRQADGTERYHSFSGDTEVPEPGEIIFADAKGNAHARRWSNRQSRLSAISPDTRRALIMAEALHDTAQADITRLVATLDAALVKGFGTKPKTATLTAPDAVFVVDPA